MINDELDVRAYVRRSSAGKARWVEPSMGSTVGLPDCWVPRSDGKQCHLELKCGVITGEYLRYDVRPEQRREIRQMVADKVAVGLLIGVKGSAGTMLFARPTDAVLSGRVKITGAQWTKSMLSVEEAKVGGFWLGVNFIFSGMA